MKKQTAVNRRNFLKTVGVAGLGTVLGGSKAMAEPAKPEVKASGKEKLPQVPQRVFKMKDKKEITVPALSLGAMFNVMDNQIILHKCLEWGVNYWDTSHMYVNGKSEEGIGKFLAKKPEVRKDVFIVSKASRAKTSAERDERLALSFKRMNTDYIDLYYGIHGMSKPEQLTDELRDWAAEAKKKGLIKYFGFSTHKNMAKCLAAAAKTDWIDAIMTTYNYTYLKDEEMQAAIEACNKKGIALIAMKTQAKKAGEDTDRTIVEHFEKKGFTDGQAKIKAVLEDKRFCSACVGMKTIALLTENVAGVLDKTKLSKADAAVLESHAQATCEGYCKGCAEICSGAQPEMPYVAEVMRYLMYYNSYGDKDMAREQFALLPDEAKSILCKVDYSAAEARCPQRIAIGKFMAEAASKLA